MQKTITAVAFVLLLGAGVVYFYLNPVEETTRGEADIQGEIYSIDDNRILVAGGLITEEYTGGLGELEGEAFWITVSEETKVLDGEEKVISFEMLQVGNRVKVWTTGVILESYPAQGTALLIIVQEEQENGVGVEKDCFVGGCSAELCTDDPEAISTCEFLPGMECLREGTSCEDVGGRCTWVLSAEAARCFSEVEEEHGEEVRQTRIGYLFEKAENFLE